METRSHVIIRQSMASEVERLTRVLERTVVQLAAKEAELDRLEEEAGVPIERRTTKLERAKQEVLTMLECACVFSCADDRPTACSLSGQFHVHPELGPCPVHPDAPGDL